MIDIFDRNGRMRQGTFNLYLWHKTKLDMSLECKTPGLFYDKPENQNFVENDQNPIPDDSDDKERSERSAKNFVEINKMLQKLHFYQKKEAPQDWKEWIDKTGSEEIFQKLLDLYTGCDYAFIEITLQSWPFTVLYQDQMYNDIKGDYIYP